MRNAGKINRNDCKLFICDQETGTERLLSWGGHEPATKEMHQLADRGHDVWIVNPDGIKTLPA